MTPVTKLVLFLLLQFVSPFTLPKRTIIYQQSSSLHAQNNNNSNAEQLLAQAKAKAIRESIPSTTDDTKSSANGIITDDLTANVQNEFALPLPPSSDDSPGYSTNNNYKLTVDIGRESGTWMDPRWGASGRRIEFTLDVSFPIASQSPEFSNHEETVPLASRDIAKSLLKCVTSQSNSVSQAYKVLHAPYARLKGGFDKMAILDGGYCIETSSSNRKSSTLRFCISVAGTDDGSSYGDVSIPIGYLYFAIPYFGIRSNDGKMAVSTKEGTVTVKQMGWHTGWRREESRILGTFRMKQMNQ